MNHYRDKLVARVVGIVSCVLAAERWEGKSSCRRELGAGKSKTSDFSQSDLSQSHKKEDNTEGVCHVMMLAFSRCAFAL